MSTRPLTLDEFKRRIDSIMDGDVDYAAFLLTDYDYDPDTHVFTVYSDGNPFLSTVIRVDASLNEEQVQDALLDNAEFQEIANQLMFPMVSDSECSDEDTENDLEGDADNDLGDADLGGVSDEY